MKTLLIAVSALAAAGAFSGCATSPPLSTSPLIPAAEAKVKFERTRNDNTEINLRVKHLAEPEKLTPPAHTYVAWMRSSKDAAPQNIGALVVDKNLTGELQSLTPMHSFELFVTAEASGQVQQPTGKPLLWTNYNQ
ncbi:MAG: hypothetical protein HY078_09550 [Elusimicrobia bacterium]|nr:hypothetical protein [Elusimicrobiota bacterium]